MRNWRCTARLLTQYIYLLCMTLVVIRRVFHLGLLIKKCPKINKEFYIRRTFVSKQQTVTRTKDKMDTEKIELEQPIKVPKLAEPQFVDNHKGNKMTDTKEEEKPKFNSLKPEDWVTRWENREIGFHKTDIHPLLEKHLDLLINGREKVKIFYPLCGKAVDMKWLADKGHTVVGVDISEMAFKEFFEEQNMEFIVEELNSIKGKLYKTKDESIKLYCCDFYEFNNNVGGNFGAIWDRGALVAINREDREKYAELMKTLMAPDCQYLLDVFDYDEKKYGGPPQFVAVEKVESLFSDKCNIKHIDRVDSFEEKHEKNWGLDYFFEIILLITLRTQKIKNTKETEKPKFNSLKNEDWEGLWETGKTEFHRENIHPSLEKHLDLVINGREKVKIFYPLCGKAVDMKWLADKGHTVVGVDLSEKAFKEFFEKQNLEYIVEELKSVQGKLYKTKDGSIKLYCCDFYDFNKDLDGTFGAIWDRGSLVAINREDREKYAELIKSLMAPGCQYLLETLDYDENKFGGPPHFVAVEKLESLYSECNIKLIEKGNIYGDQPLENFGLDYFYSVIILITLKEQ